MFRQGGKKIYKIQLSAVLFHLLQQKGQLRNIHAGLSGNFFQQPDIRLGQDPLTNLKAGAFGNLFELPDYILQEPCFRFSGAFRFHLLRGRFFLHFFSPLHPNQILLFFSFRCHLLFHVC